MAVKLANNASSTLAANIAANAEAFAIAAGDANKFPILAAGDWFPLTIVDATGNTEIVKVTARNGAALTITRGQEGTQARAFGAGSRCDIRLTAGALAGVMDDLKATLGELAALDVAPINKGGTGGKTKEDARNGLGLATVAASGKADDLSGTLAKERLPAVMGATTFGEARVRSGAEGENGFASMLPGAAARTGFFEMLHKDATRAGYIGYADFVEKIINLVAEPGHRYRFQGDLPPLIGDKEIWSKGSMPLATLEEAQAGTVKDPRAWSPELIASLAQAIAAGAGFGSGAWQNVVASRAASTIYQNTKGKAIMALVQGWARYGRCEFQISADGTNWIQPQMPWRVAQSDTTYYYNYSNMLIPKSWYYRLLPGNSYLGLVEWWELF